MGSASQPIVRLENGARRADKTQNIMIWRQEHGIQAVADQHAVGMGADGRGWKLGWKQMNSGGAGHLTVHTLRVVEQSASVQRRRLRLSIAATISIDS